MLTIGQSLEYLSIRDKTLVINDLRFMAANITEFAQPSSH